MTMLDTKPAELAHTFTTDTCCVGTPAMPACADCTSLGSETSMRSGSCPRTIDSPLLSPSMCIMTSVQPFDDTSSMPVRLQTAPPGPLPPTTVPSDIAIPVSYTHLRAHETRHDLVCRLLLEKKKKKKKKKRTLIIK